MDDTENQHYEYDVTNVNVLHNSPLSTTPQIYHVREQVAKQNIMAF